MAKFIALQQGQKSDEPLEEVLQEILEVDDDGSIPQQTYNLISNISCLEKMEANRNVDVIGIVKSVGVPKTLASARGMLTKCELTLVDHSGFEITLSIWGDKANEAPEKFAHNPVVAFHTCRISDFGGRSLSLSGSANIDPQDLPGEVEHLKEWWNGGGKNATAKKHLTSLNAIVGGSAAPLEDRSNIASIKNDHLGYNEKGDYISFKGTVAFLKQDKEKGGAWYPGRGFRKHEVRVIEGVTNAVES